MLFIQMVVLIYFMVMIQLISKSHSRFYFVSYMSLFVAGHVQFLKQAKEKGDYLIVGIFGKTFFFK
jgi:pantothenate synthetase